MEKLFQVVYGGLLFGSVYGLMALGLTLIWGSLRLLNLAHGALYLVGGYVAWVLINQLQLPIFLSFPLAMLGAAAVGAVLQLTLIDPLLGDPGWDYASIMTTVGASIVIESGALLLFGPRVKQVPAALSGQFKIGAVLMNYQALVVIGVSVFSLVAMNYFLNNSRYGMAIRAVSQNMDAAQLMGIPTRTVFLIVMCISAALAGLAGVLLSSIFYLSPTSGFVPMIKALVVTIFGGLGSVKGTIWAAYIIGILEATVQVYLGASWALPGLFLFIIAVLIVRPHGLYGQVEAERL